MKEKLGGAASRALDHGEGTLFLLHSAATGAFGSDLGWWGDERGR